MGGFGLIMVYKTEKMGDGCMSCPCDSRQIAIALDLVSLDPFILFFSFRMGKKRIAQETHSYIYIHPIHTHLLPYYTVSSLSGGTWNTSKKQSPFCLVPPLSLSVVQTEKK
jgi:hypothetical protein